MTLLACLALALGARAQGQPAAAPPDSLAPADSALSETAPPDSFARAERYLPSRRLPSYTAALSRGRPLAARLGSYWTREIVYDDSTRRYVAYERVGDHDELCLCLLESMAVELDRWPISMSLLGRSRDFTEFRKSRRWETSTP